jgi:simple sugar transport system permease protein
VTDEERAPETEEPASATPPDTKPEPRPGIVPRFARYLVTANNVMVTVYALVLSMVVGGILIILTNEEVRKTFTYFFAKPTDALSASWDTVASAYTGLFRASIVDPEDISKWLSGNESLTDVLYPLSETLTYAAPLILAGLAVGLAFRAGLFNIGAEGQVMVGAVAAGIVGFQVHAPFLLHIVLVLAAGMIAGGIYGAIPGILKARTGAHEVITSIMLNYVAINFLSWILNLGWVKDPKQPEQSYAVDGNARMWTIMGSDNRANIGIIVAVAAALGVWWLLSRSTAGYRMRAVGLNPEASRTAGMSVPKTFMMTMATAGVLAGLAGALAVAGSGAPYALSRDVSANMGFDGITVALLGRAKPGGIIAAGFLFGALRAGSSQMQDLVPIEMVIVLQAVIVIFIAAPALVKALLRLREPAGGLSISEAKGW